MKLVGRNIVLIIFLIVALGSCKGKRDIVKDRKLEHKITRNIIKNLDESSNRPEWFKTRAASSVSGEGEETFKASIKIRKNSIVWISVTKYGLAGFNFLFSKDSVKYIDHINEEYQLGTYDFIEEIAQTSVEHSMLENVLLGLPIFMEEKGKYKSWSDDEEFAYVLSSLSKKQWEKIDDNKELKKDSLGYRYWINPDIFKVQKFRLDNFKDNTYLIIEYKDWEKFEEYIIPKSVTIEIKGAGNENHLKFKMDYSKTKINKPTSFPFKIPKSYRRIYQDAKELENEQNNNPNPPPANNLDQGLRKG